MLTTRGVDGLRDKPIQEQRQPLHRPRQVGCLQSQLHDPHQRGVEDESVLRSHVLNVMRSDLEQGQWQEVEFGQQKLLMKLKQKFLK